MGLPIIGQNSADQGSVKEIVDNGPKIRLLYCFNCKTIEELPDFEGNPDDDVLLNILIEPHQSAGVPHTGHIIKVGVNLWKVESYRKEIIKQIREGVSGGLANLDPDYYTTKATFYEDAMTCYKQHNRPKDLCPDWKSEKKHLVPKTAAERKDAGLAAPSTASKVFLCDFCPVKSTVMTKQRGAAGMYK